MIKCQINLINPISGWLHDNHSLNIYPDTYLNTVLLMNTIVLNGIVNNLCLKLVGISVKLFSLSNF